MDQKMANPNYLRGVGEIASALRVSPKTVRAWIDAGMPCLYIGQKWRAKYDEIWEWLKTQDHTKPVK